MPTLYFYDWDCLTNEDLELSREAYETLLDFCFSHSETISFLIKDDEPIKYSDWLEQFRIPCPDGLDRSSHSLKAYYTEEDKVKMLQWCEECEIAREKGLALPKSPLEDK